MAELPLRKIQLETPLRPRAVSRRLAEVTAETPRQLTELWGEVGEHTFRVGLPGRGRRNTVVLQGTIEPQGDGSQLQAEVRLNQTGIGALLLAGLAGLALSAFFLSQGLPVYIALLPSSLIVSNLLSAYSNGQRLTRTVKRLIS